MPLPRPLPRDRRYGMGAMHWLIIACCLLILLQGLDRVRIGWLSANWPVADAVIVSNAPAGRRHAGSLTLEYRVDGKSYRLNEASRTLVGEDGGHLPPGATTTVRVNPRNPAEAVSFGGMQNVPKGWQWMLLFSIGVPVLLAWNAWYRPRSH